MAKAKDQKRRKPKRTAATTGRLNLDLGIRRKAGFEWACAYREMKLVEAVKAWMDRFISITPGLPTDLMPAPMDNDPHTVLPSLTGGPEPRKPAPKRNTPRPPATGGRGKGR